MFQTRPEDISIERKAVTFGDLRGWIAAIKQQGELTEITAEGDWNIELGSIMRLAQGPGTGKALLFNNIKDYNTPQSRCRRMFGSSTSTSFPRRIGTGSTAAATSSPTAAASPGTRKREP